MSEELKKFVLEKRKKGELVVSTLEGYMSVDVGEFIKQPADGILYDLNRLEEIALTFMDEKWVNDFAVALTIRKLKEENALLSMAVMGKHPNIFDENEKLWEFYNAHWEVEKGIVDLDLHAKAVERLRKAQDALQQIENKK